MIDFLNWYFNRALQAQFRFIFHLLTYFEDFMGITINFRYFFSPIFNDNSWFGRIMSLIIRSVVIFCGLISISFFAIVLALVPIAWTGSLLVWIWEPIFLLIPLFGMTYYALYTYSSPRKLYPHNHPNELIEVFANAQTKKFLITRYDAQYFADLIGTSSVKHFLERAGLPDTPLLTILTQANYHDTAIESKVREIATNYYIREVRPSHIFVAHLILQEQNTTPFLQAHKIDMQVIQKYLSWNEHEYNLHNPPHLWDADYHVPTKGGTNVTWQGTVTPILNQYSRDLTMQVINNPIRVIRHYLIDEIEQGLQKNRAASVILAGDIGVGKDKLVEIIAQEINRGNINGFLWSKRIVQLNIGQLYAGAADKGNFEKRVEDIIEEINRSGNIILYLNDFKSAIEMSASGTISLLSLLQDPISKKKLHIIGSLTPKQIVEIEDKYPQFMQEFTIIQVSEPSEDETIEILFNESLLMEQNLKVFLTYPLIKLVYSYANQYIQDDRFPQKALRLMEDAISHTLTQRLGTMWNTIYGPRSPVLEPALNAVLSKKLHINVGETQKSEADKLLHLEEHFAEKIIGQSDAVKAVAEILRRNRVGLRNRNKPVGSFLFVGPTGVGKTKMAKVLAEQYFGTEERMIRFDMSEFQNTDSIERLIGSPERGSSYLTLTQQLRKQPFSLVLLDELEKAHPRILDIFLQILDDGRLTDAQGETIHCNEAIFIATSNAGTQTITEMFTKNGSPTAYETINKEIYHILNQFFRIEFLNRFDDIIVFKPLTKPILRKIVGLELQQIANQLFDEKKITVTFSPAVIEEILKIGYNEELGARPLERAIQNIIESKLARLILENQVHSGDSINI